MEWTNLDIGILYWMCENAPDGGRTNVSAGAVIRSFPDIPAEDVESTLRLLAGSGLVREDRGKFEVTDRGLSKIRAYTLDHPPCDVPRDDEGREE